MFCSNSLDVNKGTFYTAEDLVHQTLALYMKENRKEVIIDEVQEKYRE